MENSRQSKFLQARHPILSRFRFPLTVLFAAAAGAAFAASFSQHVSHGPGRSLGAGGQKTGAQSLNAI